MPWTIHDPLWLQRVTSEWRGAGLPRPTALKATGVQERARRAGVRRRTRRFALSGCEVQSEEPAGMGFGDAALQIASVMKMNPWTNQGAPVDGMKIQLPIRLVAADDAAAAATPPAAPARLLSRRRPGFPDQQGVDGVGSRCAFGAAARAGPPGAGCRRRGRARAGASPLASGGAKRAKIRSTGRSSTAWNSIGCSRRMKTPRRRVSPASRACGTATP